MYNIYTWQRFIAEIHKIYSHLSRSIYSNANIFSCISAVNKYTTKTYIPVYKYIYIFESFFNFSITEEIPNTCYEM